MREKTPVLLGADHVRLPLGDFTLGRMGHFLAALREDKQMSPESERVSWPVRIGAKSW